MDNPAAGSAGSERSGRRNRSGSRRPDEDSAAFEAHIGDQRRSSETRFGCIAQAHGSSRFSRGWWRLGCRCARAFPTAARRLDLHPVAGAAREHQAVAESWAEPLGRLKERLRLDADSPAARIRSDAGAAGDRLAAAGDLASRDSAFRALRRPARGDPGARAGPHSSSTTTWSIWCRAWSRRCCFTTRPRGGSPGESASSARIAATTGPLTLCGDRLIYSTRPGSARGATRLRLAARAVGSGTARSWLG